MDIGRILQQDFKAYKLAHTDNRFDLATVFSNRLISNVVFAENKRLCLFGFVLREVAVANLKAEQTGGGTLKVVADATDAFLAVCETALSGSEIDLLKTWRAYHTFLSSVRKSSLTEQEKITYSEDQGITGEALRYLYEKFLLNKTEFGEPGTNIPQGCLNEALRIWGVFGISERDLPLLAVLTATVWLYGYVAERWVNEEVEGEYIKALKTRFATLLEPTSKLLDSAAFPTLDLIAEPATNVLAEVLLEWRRDYIRFQEPAGPKGAKPQLPISKETRDKLNESVKGAIERDLFGRRGKG